jgi:hypothetical protein
LAQELLPRSSRQQPGDPTVTAGAHHDGEGVALSRQTDDGGGDGNDVVGDGEALGLRATSVAKASAVSSELPGAW